MSYKNINIPPMPDVSMPDIKPYNPPPMPDIPPMPPPWDRNWQPSKPDYPISQNFPASHSTDYSPSTYGNEWGSNTDYGTTNLSITTVLIFGSWLFLFIGIVYFFISILKWGFFTSLVWALIFIICSWLISKSVSNLTAIIAIVFPPITLGVFYVIYEILEWHFLIALILSPVIFIITVVNLYFKDKSKSGNNKTASVEKVVEKEILSPQAEELRQAIDYILNKKVVTREELLKLDKFRQRLNISTDVAHQILKEVKHKKQNDLQDKVDVESTGVVNIYPTVDKKRFLTISLGIAFFAGLALIINPIWFPERLNGRIAFVSARDGNSDIYIMNTSGSVNRLTNDRFNESALVWSPDGTRIAFTSNRTGENQIYTMNASGTNQNQLTRDCPSEFPAWSPDGTRIAFAANCDRDNEIFIINTDGTNQIRLTDNSLEDNYPTWSPDGTRIAFMSDRYIYIMEANGSNPIRLARGYFPAWSPDGTRIAYSILKKDTWEWYGDHEIYVVNVDGTEKTRLTDNSVDDNLPAWSPDGNYITFISKDRSGRWEIYMMNANGAYQTNLSNNLSDDMYPTWAP